MPATAVLGAQWGDEGKGKISHLVGAGADLAVRFNGGTNAGHTVVSANQEPSAAEREFKFHLIPSGALHPGCQGVLGNGMVIEMVSLAKEYAELTEALGAAPSLYVSEKAHLILPYHPILEQLDRAASELDTTARGIGPAYQDKVARCGLRAYDLLDADGLSEKVERNLERHRALHPGAAALREMDGRGLTDQLLEASEPFREKIVDTSWLVNNALDDGKRVIFEGAQGALLDIDFGTYPFVTSSHATIGGVGIGSGVSPRRIDRVIGAAKAFTSRVGAGPFPTEDNGCIGTWLRGTGENPWDEFGTTTGRPRRCGWLDLVALRYAARLNEFTELALVKLDVLSGLSELKVATAYRCRGVRLERFPTDSEWLSECEPIYESLPGWSEEIRDVRAWDDLPAAAQTYVRFISSYIEVPVRIISVGRAYEETIWIDS